MINTILTSKICLLVCWTALVASSAEAAAAALKPNYWGQHQFFIPYQPNQQGKLLSNIAKVELLISRSGPRDWTTLETAQPNVQGFSYHAPEDGGYWFALRHLDQRGQPWPSADVQPQMHMIIDTQQPELTLEAILDANGEAVIRYEARDANLQNESLILEVRADSQQWTTLSAGKADIAQPNRLVGRVRWRPPVQNGSIEVRGAIVDRAGHRGSASTGLPLHDRRSPLNGPSLGNPDLGRQASPGSSTDGSLTLTNPFVASPGSQAAGMPSQAAGMPSQVAGRPRQAARLPSQDWPEANRLPSSKQDSPSRQTAPPTQLPPRSNPYSVASRAGEQRVTGQLVADGQRRAESRADDGLQSLQITPLDPELAPPLMGNLPRTAREGRVVESDDLWSAPAAAENAAERVVNSQTFDIEYDLQSVGPWGVSKVELWGTSDSGRTWKSFGVDPDNRSPFRVTVPEAGTYGFRILVDGANSAGSTPPQAGAEPELVVDVDLQPPTAELLSAELGTANLADQLLVRWSAADTNLESRPIALFYSSYPNGPWSTIASGLENTGSYTWRIERHVPGRFYLRLEVRDVAGNLSTYQTQSPVALARPQPTGRLKGVRPITNSN